MTQQPSEPPAPENLLGELTAVPDNNLERIVITAENAMGSLVEPVYSRRKMQCYSVTESELMQLSLVNTLVAFAWSIVSGVGVFLIDIVKDIMLSGNIPEAAKSIGLYIIPVLIFILAVAFFGVHKARAWRTRLIDLIKEESEGEAHLEEVKVEGWKLQWPIGRK